MQNWDQTLSKKLKKVGGVFSVDKVLNVSTDPVSVAKYYKVNIIPYSLIYRGNDFIHTALTPSGKTLNKQEDLLAQARMVEKYFTEGTKNVLELATGRGANSFYLAREHPEVNFVGLDLPGGHTDFAIKKAKKTKNFKVEQGDYHDLNKYPENFFDIAFIVEALCHSEDKTKVLKEVKRILKPNGLFIIFDAFTKNRTLDENENMVKKLVERGMAVPDFPTEDRFEKMVEQSGLKLVKKTNLSEMTMPTFRLIEKQANRFFSFPLPVQKLIVKTFPSEFTYNAISGYFLGDTIEANISTYLEYVLKKD